MRKLAYFAYAFSAAALLCALILPLLPVLLLIGLTVFAVIWFSVKQNSRVCFLRPIALGLIIGLFWCGSRNVALNLRTSAMCGESRDADVTVLTYPGKTTYGASVDVRVEGLRCRLYLDEMMELIPGDNLSVSAHFELTADKTDSDYHLSRGIPLFGYADGIAQKTGYSQKAWRYWPARIGFFLRESIERCFDAETTAFLKAILTGERYELLENTFLYSMMKRAGIIHCVAVSGMHLSFLTAFLYILFGRGTGGSICCIPVILLFMAITGFTPSVVRAGVMQLSLCLSGLIRREYDSDTALSFSLLVLLLWNPYSIVNAGLQLSFASTLGIIHFSPMIAQALPHLQDRAEKGKVSGRVLRYVRSSLSVSFSTMILTVPLTALYFHQFAVLAPLTNLLSLWAVSLCFGLGLLTALLGFVWPAGAVVVGYPVRWLYCVVRLIVTLLGKLPFASLNPLCPMLGIGLILCYVLLAYYRWMPGISCRLAGYLIAASVTIMSAFALNCLYERSIPFTVTALDVGQGQCIVLCGSNFTVVADCGGSASQNAGDILADYLQEQGRSKIDILLLTHYHQDHANGVTELMARLPIRQLIVPPTESENEYAAAILAAADKQTSIAVVCDYVEHWTIDELQMTVTPPLGETGDNEQGLCLLCSYGDYDVLLTGDAGELTELRLLERVLMPDVEILIAGHHGSRKSVSQRLLQTAAPDMVVVSVGRNVNGLPSEETLERIRSTGAEVIRTDEEETIQIRCRKGKGQNE